LRNGKESEKGLFLPEKLPEKWTEKYLEKTLEKWVDMLQKVK